MFREDNGQKNLLNFVLEKPTKNRSTRQIKSIFFRKWKNYAKGLAKRRKDSEKAKIETARTKLVTVQAFITTIQKDLEHDINIVGAYYRSKFINAVKRIMTIIRYYLQFDSPV